MRSGGSIDRPGCRCGDEEGAGKGGGIGQPGPLPMHQQHPRQYFTSMARYSASMGPCSRISSSTRATTSSRLPPTSGDGCGTTMPGTGRGAHEAETTRRIAEAHFHLRLLQSSAHLPLPLGLFQVQGQQHQVSDGQRLAQPDASKVLEPAQDLRG